MSRKGLEILNAGFYDSPEKDEIRDLLLAGHPDPVRVLTFGGKYCLDGKWFAKFERCQVRSLERNKKIFDMQLKETKNHPNIFVLNKNFSEYLDYFEGPFDVTFLDFNAILSTKIEEDISRMFENKFERRSLIGITLQKGRDNFSRIKNTYCFNKVCSCSYKTYCSDRENAISTTVIALARRKRTKIKEIITNRRTYRNSIYGIERGATMMFWMFQVC